MNTICAPRLGFPVPIGLGFPAGQMHAAIMNARRGPLRSPSRPDLCPWHVSPMPRPAVGAAGAGGSGEKKPPKTWKPNFNEKLVSSVQRKQSKGLPPAAIAAMALAPLAALAYQFSKSPEWQKALEQFAARLLMSASHWVRSDDFKEMATRADEGLTYMDWTAGSLGIDLSRVWDPELYVKLKQAAAADQPAMFWNAVYDRIKYVAKIPQVGGTDGDGGGLSRSSLGSSSNPRQTKMSVSTEPQFS